MTEAPFCGLWQQDDSHQRRRNKKNERSSIIHSALIVLTPYSTRTKYVGSFLVLVLGKSSSDALATPISSLFMISEYTAVNYDENHPTN